MPNQKDVAHYAKVSSATVSRYLADPTLVSKAKAETIQDAIDALGYRVDYTAKCLKMGRSFHVGIIAPSIGPFYWEVFSAMQSAFSDAGFFNILVFTRANGYGLFTNRDKVLSLVRNKYLEGIIYFPWNNSDDDEVLAELARYQPHYVVVDKQIPGSPCAQVYIDNYGAGRKAARALLDKGHREFLFLWGVRAVPSATARFEGFRDELKDAGIPLPVERQLDCEFFSAVAYAAAKGKLGALPPFTAVFASNDSSAVGFMRAAHEGGLRCPDDYSIIGYDNNQEFAPFLNPPLCTFQQHNYAIGEQASAILLEMMSGEGEPRQVMLTPEFIERASLGSVPH